MVFWVYWLVDYNWLVDKIYECYVKGIYWYGEWGY